MISKSDKGFITFILLTIIAVFSLFLAGGLTYTKPADTIKSTSLDNKKLIVLQKTPDSSKNMLQLNTFSFITPTSPPPPHPPPPSEVNAPVVSPPPAPTGKICLSDKLPDCECMGGYYPDQVLKCKPESSGCDYMRNCWILKSKQPTRFNANLNNPDCALDPKLLCASKPIIYLYPTKTTIIDVYLDIPGKVIVSDPLYPTNGWQNIQAHPDGTLVYNEKKYQELYYESSISNLNKPEYGTIIKINDLREELKSATTKLGLNQFEQEEFLDYWVSRLTKLDSPYILFSVLDTKEKNRIDHVEINPEPNTRIEFMAYFKPLKKPIRVNPLILPLNPPKRTGFVSVEWGGILDTN